MLLVASCSLGMQAAPSRRTERNFYLRQTLQPPWTDTLSHYVAISNDVRLCVIICNNVILCSTLMLQINKTSGSPLFFFNQSGKRHLSWSSDVLPCTHHRAMILGFFLIMHSEQAGSSVCYAIYGFWLSLRPCMSRLYPSPRPRRVWKIKVNRALETVFSLFLHSAA